MRGYIWERKDRGRGVYTLRVDAGKDHETGKRRQLSRTVKVSGPKPKQQAEQKLREFLAEVDAGHHHSTPHAQMTVADAVEDWFSSFHALVVAGAKGVGTERKYRDVIDYYILPRLRDRRLADFSTEAIDDFYEELLKSGRTGHGRPNGSGQIVGKVRAGGPLSAATVRNVHTVIRLMFARAVRYHWVPSMTVNPATEASPPRIKKRKKTPPTSEQAQALLAEAKRMDPDWYAYLRLSAVAGDRRGEVTAVHHAAFDVADQHQATMRVESALTVGLQGVVETEAPKSEAGFRTISIGEETALAVKEVMRRQEERAQTCGGLLVDDPYLFAANVDGSEPWDPRRVTRRFTYLRNKLGFTSVRLNDLRHYVATQLLGKGVDVITVAGRLGHDPTVTQRVYAEFIPENDKEAAGIMEDLLDGELPVASLVATRRAERQRPLRRP
jgi:integrase